MNQLNILIIVNLSSRISFIQWTQLIRLYSFTWWRKQKQFQKRCMCFELKDEGNVSRQKERVEQLYSIKSHLFTIAHWIYLSSLNVFIIKWQGIILIRFQLSSSSFKVHEFCLGSGNIMWPSSTSDFCLFSSVVSVSFKKQKYAYFYANRES